MHRLLALLLLAPLAFAQGPGDGAEDPSLPLRDVATLSRLLAERDAAGDVEGAKALRVELAARFARTPDGIEARRALDEQLRVAREERAKEYRAEADRLLAVRTRLKQWVEQEQARQAAVAAPPPELPPQPAGGPTPPVDTPPATPPGEAEPEVCILDFEGVPEARLGEDSDTVLDRIGKPSCVNERQEDGVAEWVYASRGLLVVVEVTSLRVIGVQALGDRTLVPESARADFHAYVGKTAKGIGLGAEKSAVLGAYGRARMSGKRFEEGSGLAYVKDDVEMTFSGRGSAVSRITIERKR